MKASTIFEHAALNFETVFELGKGTSKMWNEHVTHCPKLLPNQAKSLTDYWTWASVVCKLYKNMHMNNSQSMTATNTFFQPI